MYLLLVGSSFSVRFLGIVKFLLRPDVGRQVAIVVLRKDVSPTLGGTPTERYKPWLLAGTLDCSGCTEGSCSG